MLIVLLLDPRSFDTFALPKSVASHTTGLLVAALLVWLIARHGRSMIVWSPLHAGMGAVVIAFALATPLALDPYVALFGTFKRYLGLTQMLDNAVLYIAVATLFRDGRSLRLLAAVCIGVAVPVLGYAAIQRMDLDPLRFEQGSTRIPISTLGNPDMAGGFVSIIGVTSLGLAYLWTARALAWERIALGLIGGASVAILYTTGVRAGALAIAGGWLAIAILAFRLPQIGVPRALGTLAGGLLLGAGILLSPIGARVQPDYLRSDTALLSRFDMWRAAALAVVERPVSGIGPDNFAVAYPSRRTEFSIRTGELQTSTHDIWLYMATSSGIVGLACFVLLVTLALDRGFHLASVGRPAALAVVPLVAYLAQALVNVNEIGLDWVLWVSVGLIAGNSGAAISRPRRALSRSARLAGATAIGIALVASLAGVVPRLFAGEAMLATEAYSNAGRPEAIRYGQDAVGSDPRRPEMWSSYGSALYRSGDAAAALNAFTVAAERQPWHPLAWMNLAIAWSGTGNLLAAYEAAKRIPIADPYDGIGRELLAQVAYDRGDFARAAKEGELAIAYRAHLGPRASAYFTTISAYVQLKDLERAETLSSDAVARFPNIPLRLQFAAILADRGKIAEALVVVDSLLGDYPNSVDARVLKDALLKK